MLFTGVIVVTLYHRYKDMKIISIRRTASKYPHRDRRARSGDVKHHQGLGAREMFRHYHHQT